MLRELGYFISPTGTLGVLKNGLRMFRFKDVCQKFYSHNIVIGPEQYFGDSMWSVDSVYHRPFSSGGPLRHLHYLLVANIAYHLKGSIQTGHCYTVWEKNIRQQDMKKNYLNNWRHHIHHHRHHLDWSVIWNGDRLYSRWTQRLLFVPKTSLVSKKSE